jgi:hypothetical protein
MGPQILFSPNSAFRARLAGALLVLAMGRLALCRRPIPAKAPTQPITMKEKDAVVYRKLFLPLLKDRVFEQCHRTDPHLGSTFVYLRDYVTQKPGF